MTFDMKQNGELTPEEIPSAPPEELLLDVLEKAIDANGIDCILEVLHDVCYLKAEHLRSNWQDNISAVYWERIGRRIQKIQNYT